ncbi:alkyl/aryl-sulfatase [Nocardioides insulae]|uniref:alkyl/aryl-sulfatase n=1 Tax=Nocardioides insulae TaxID=394734 RepID=UPI0003FD01AE|nr:alkyl sulfatase dimerization domain-containing protein [Nocardioides insulae]
MPDITTVPQPPTAATLAAQKLAAEQLPHDDGQDFADARRGFIATLDPIRITAESGRKVWDLERFGFVEGEAPDTVHPSLWRQAKLNLHHGLFEVTDRIYQIRGFDIANMTVILGETGFVVIDPLTSVEGARAGLDLVREHLGDRPVTAVIYTHSHADHFGGVRGIVSEEDLAEGRVRIVAPAGFLEHAISENVYAGTAMGRRSQYMFGPRLPAGESGQVCIGLGAALAAGTISLLPPTDLIEETGTELTLDGVRIVFQYTPDAEAPAEMNFHFPDLRALCMAENVSHNMHNLYTLRGAQVRDAAAWSNYIRDALDEFGDETDVMFISHHWPVWGQDRVREFLEKQRDLYRYLHDETLRLAAHGYTPIEIAERVELPEALSSFWANRGYYGTLNHNVKAVYQFYLGWYDGNPAHLHPHEPTEAGRRYVDCMGGADAVLAKAREYFEAGDYRWVAEMLNHLVFAEPDNHAARALQADTYEQLGYQSEAGTWRNSYLTAAMELRGAAPRGGAGSVQADTVTAMTAEMLVDYLAIRLNGPRAGNADLSLRIVVSDTGDERFVRVRHGVLTQRGHLVAVDEPATVALAKHTLALLSMGARTVDDLLSEGLIETSDAGATLRSLLGLCDEFDGSFAIVSP